jgi:signal transduction histidine kinase
MLPTLLAVLLFSRRHGGERGEQGFRALSESEFDGQLILDRERKVRFANESAGRMFDVPAAALVGRAFDSLLSTDSHTRLAELYGSAELPQPLATSVELEAVAPDGGGFPVDVRIRRASPSYEAWYAVILRDRRAREELVRALTERAAQLARSNRELEEFAYVASHDLQEPLRMISSYSQLIAQRYTGRLDADADEFLGYSADGAKRMQQLIDDLLSYSRVGTRGAPFQMVPLEEVLAGVLKDLSGVVAESGAVVTHDPLPEVRADPSQIGQLLQNLIGNALKFRGKEPPRIHVGVSHDRTGRIVSVRDNGIGIPPEYHEKIFSMFQKLHPREKYPGTGIGLSICKKIVERHGGRIWVESSGEPGQGTTFFFTLAPVPGPVPEPVTQNPRPPPTRAVVEAGRAADDLIAKRLKELV